MGLHRYSGDSWVSRICTKPLAGVSARESVDLGTVRSISTEGAQSGFVYVNVSVTSEQFPALVPSPTKNVVRTQIFRGSGLRVTLAPPTHDNLPGEHTWMMETVGNVDIKGWIPVSLM